MNHVDEFFCPLRVISPTDRRRRPVIPLAEPLGSLSRNSVSLQDPFEPPEAEELALQRTPDLDRRATSELAKEKASQNCNSISPRCRSIEGSSFDET